MSGRLAASLVVLAVLQTLPAHAQGRDRERTLTPSQAARELANYADCLASRRKARAQALVLSPYASKAQAEAADRITRSIDEDCIRGGFDDVELTVRPDVLAGAVARALLHREYPDLPVVIEGSAINPESERTRAARLGVAERLGRCVVWNDPAGVQALIKADAGSPAERQAMAGLGDALGLCIQEGSTIRLNRPFVRDIAAISAYRLARELRPHASGTERG